MGKVNPILFFSSERFFFGGGGSLLQHWYAEIITKLYCICCNLKKKYSGNAVRYGNMEIVHLNRKASNKSRERYYISLVSSFIKNFIKTITCPNAMQHDCKSCTSTQKYFLS